MIDKNVNVGADCIRPRVDAIDPYEGRQNQ